MHAGRAAYSSDAEVCKALEVAEALGALDLKGMNAGLGRRVIDALADVAIGTIKGAIAGWRPHDAKELCTVLRDGFGTGETPLGPR